MNTEWWDGKYLYRRSLSVAAPIEGCPMHHPVTFVLPAAVKHNNKTILETYDDIEIVYQDIDESETPFTTPIERDVIDYEDQTYITFETQEHLEAGSSSQRYYLYYGNPNASGDVSRERIEGQAADIASDIPYLPSWAHWPLSVDFDDPRIAYTRPGEHWNEGYTSNPAARATFKYPFSRARIISESDRDMGILRSRVNIEPWQEHDLYSPQPNLVSVVEYEGLPEGRLNELLIASTGRSRYENTGADINVKKVQFSHALQVNDLGEQVNELAWSSFVGRA